MSVLITNAALLYEADTIGRIYAAVAAGSDTAFALAMALGAYEQATAFAGDPVQFSEWFGATKGMYGGSVPSSGTGTGNAFGSGGGFGAGASFGGGSAILSRPAILPLLLYSKFENMRAEIARYGKAVDASIISLGTYAAWYNSTPFSVLWSPTFAAAYFYAYGQQSQLPAASVFAPEGIALCTFVCSAAPGVFMAGHFPFANGYALPAGTTDGIGYPLYAGGQPSAQGFAPLKNIECLVTVTINGTCAITVTAPKTGGGTGTWTAVLDSAAASATPIVLTPGGAYRCAGDVTAVSFAGAATAGGVTIQSGAPER